MRFVGVEEQSVWSSGVAWREECAAGAARRKLVDGFRNMRGPNLTMGLIRLRGHNLKGGYDVHNVRYDTEAKPAEFYR